MATCKGVWCGGDGAEEISQLRSDLVPVFGGQMEILGPICQQGLWDTVGAYRGLGYTEGYNAGRTQVNASALFMEFRRLQRATSGMVRRALNAAVGPQGTTPAPITGLGFPVLAGNRYRLEANLIYRSSSGNAGLQLALAVPNGASEVSLDASIATGPSAIAHVHAGSLGVFVGPSVGPGPSDVVANVGASFVATADGTVALRFQAAGAGTPTVTIQPASTAALFDLTD